MMRDWILRQPLWVNKLAAALIMVGCFAFVTAVTVVPLAVYVEPKAWWAMLPIGVMGLAAVGWIISYRSEPASSN